MPHRCRGARLDHVNPSHRYRTVIVSDAHVGTPDARGECLLRFLESIDCDYLVLNGDLLDVWNRQRRRWHRSPATTRLFQQLLRPAAVGTEVIYVPGTTTNPSVTTSGDPSPGWGCIASGGMRWPMDAGH